MIYKVHIERYPFGRVVRRFGTWSNKAGKWTGKLDDYLHRSDLPAIETSNGQYFFWKNGKFLSAGFK